MTELTVVYEETIDCWRVVDDEGRQHGDLTATRHEAEIERQRELRSESEGR